MDGCGLVERLDGWMCSVVVGCVAGADVRWRCGWPTARLDARWVERLDLWVPRYVAGWMRANGEVGWLDA